MTKVILFDLDGLVIKKKTKLFSERASEELGFPYEQVSEFFDSEFRLCSFGKADLKEKIKPHLIKWGYKGSVDDFLKYWFEKESEVNSEVIEIIDNIRSKGTKCYIATRQEKYRKQYLLDVLGLKGHFDGIFCTCDIGFDKWEKILYT
jgi:putative hydrolase of the HAD superfamily